MNDPKFALRRLAKHPGFAAVVILTPALGITVPPLAAQRGPACSFVAFDSVEISAERVARLRIVLPAGSLRVQGKSGASTLEVHFRHCASTEEVLAAIELDTERTGDELRITQRLPEHLFSRTEGVVARTDLVAIVPSDLILRLENGLGPAQLIDVGPAWLRDSQGPVSIQGVGGDLDLEAGPGDVEILGVSGRVRVSQSVGAITARDVSGNVEVTEHHTGPVHVHRIGGSVVIRDGQAGDVRASEVEGDLLVGRMTKGRVEHSGVRGAVRFWNR